MTDPSVVEPSYLPWDTSAGNRFAHYSAEDHGAPLWIAALLGMVYSLGVLLMRLYIKRRVFGWDDGLITASSVAALGQFALIYGALKFGLGKIAANVKDISRVGTLTFTSRVLSLIALYLAKLSVLAILNRIFVRDQPGLKILCKIAFGFTTVSGIAAVLVSSLGCPSSAFYPSGHCDNEVARWSIITGLDVATEVALVLLPPCMVYTLQMRVQTKIRIVAAFCFRLGVIVLSAMHLNYLIRYTKGPPSPLLITQTLIWQQILLAVSLVTATIPNLKAFLQSLSARWGEADMGTYGNYGTGNYGTGTYELRSMNAARVRDAPKPVTKESIVRVKASSEFNARAFAQQREVGERDSVGSTSGGSQDLIIRKETTFTISRSEI